MAKNNYNNERLEEGKILEEEEKRLEEIVKSMKLNGKTHEQICNFLKRRAEYYLKVMDRYCNEKEYNKYKKEE